jgi:hypothetical protein
MLGSPASMAASMWAPFSWPCRQPFTRSSRRLGQQCAAVAPYDNSRETIWSAD